ncbi:MAG: amylo-alpha-1,6-glucosidase, partial [Nocardioidaceae bacterium]
VMQTRSRQPWLHEMVTLVRAPGVALSPPSGQISGGADGLYWRDRRLLSRVEVGFEGRPPVPVSAVMPRGDRAQFVGAFREAGDPGADPTVFLERERRVDGDGMCETVSLVSEARETVEGVLEIAAECDLAEMGLVKRGVAGTVARPFLDDDGWSWVAPDGTRVTFSVSVPPDDREAGGALGWKVRLGRGQRFTVELELRAADDPLAPLYLPVDPPVDGAGPTRPRVRSHPRVDAFLARSVADVHALTVADGEEPEDRFVAAGAPWYLTLFGRDSLWAARMMLPAGVALADGTLRALGRRQGRLVDEATSEEPGKIIHEVRSTRDRSALELPPLYFGTVDATPLWLLLWHDAWRWGLSEDRVRALLPQARAAIGWVRRAAESGGGFVSYRDTTAHGLSNQGWKDSADAIQFRDGSLAEAPIALCEVHGYAYAAATAYAAVVERLGIGDGAEWRAWAEELAQRFRGAFWVEDTEGDYPAVALDARGNRVDTVTSNIGHLLGTGLLSAGEEAKVVRRLASPTMDSGFGLRTMSAASAGFNPLSYHAGSVWTHDTAIAVSGLARMGTPAAAELASSLFQGVLDAATTFDDRIPELYGGHARSELAAPAPYPAACRPQAWSAASAVALVAAVLGLDPDVPGRVLRVRPLRPWPFGELTVEGLTIGGAPLDLIVDETGGVRVGRAPDWLEVVIGR